MVIIFVKLGVRYIQLSGATQGEKSKTGSNSCKGRVPQYTTLEPA